ncbi:transglutaminase domain-containing protein [Methanoplanus endosymbiosus]|uniref:Transglutaminase domain-containing protein n=1 Tax=Methanoplanus endosymbiosus TaxID=33865 RepID=A0A9E7PP63_9EURY|nr:transglutaminase domain-containing protein [Methanoplanus endosymbiosus]UUX92499.1 transglutaminase domain-containing protein [Methanoplanus endosymbiosus]
MKVAGAKVLAAMIIIFILSAGCTGTSGEDTDIASETGDDRQIIDKSPAADNLYSKGLSEFKSGNYRTAEGYFADAENFYQNLNNKDKTLNARYMKYKSLRAYIEYPYNQTVAKEEMAAKIPGITEEEMNLWLSGDAQKITTDNETLYYENTVINYLYANSEVLQNFNYLNFGYVSEEALSRSKELSGPFYTNPRHYKGIESLNIPKDKFTADGIIKIWFPLPLNTEAQSNVTVNNLSYEEYIVKGPVTDGSIGYVYYEIPGGKIAGDLIISADIGFTYYEHISDTDPSPVMEYNRSSPEYLHYTASVGNTEISEDIKNKAEEIAGGEKNPYLQAKLIYNYIITTYPYSQVPHLSLDTVEPKIAETAYMYETGNGDCGTQSMYFSALCRALGIPARALGGYQMVMSDSPGEHFWAEYYIEGYGWVPCDPTVAETADWVEIPDEKREKFKEFYSDSLDARRFVIQKETDAVMIPLFEEKTVSPDNLPVFRPVLQSPAFVHDESETDIDLFARGYFSIELKEV